MVADDTTTYEQVYAKKDILIAYEIRDRVHRNGVLNEDVFLAIVKFERQLTMLPAWTVMCDRLEKFEQSLCRFGASLPSYILPTLQSEADKTFAQPDNLSLDGFGVDALPLRGIFRC